MKGFQRIASGLSQRDLYAPDRDEYNLDTNGQPMTVLEYEQQQNEINDSLPLETKHRFKQPISMTDYYSQQVTIKTSHNNQSARLQSMARSGWGDRVQRPNESNVDFQRRVNK